MSGWGVYCTFYNNGQTARTNTAYMYVAARQQTQQPVQQQSQTQTFTNHTPVYYSYGTFGGYGYDENGNLEYDVYYPDGSYTTYYWDGSSYTDYLNGSFSYQSNDGSYSYYNGDGSYVEQRPDGSWEAYDASTDTTSGGVDYDMWEDYFNFSDDQLVEIYNDVYGWGYLA